MYTKKKLSVQTYFERIEESKCDLIALNKVYNVVILNNCEISDIVWMHILAWT